MAPWSTASCQCSTAICRPAVEFNAKATSPAANTSDAEVRISAPTTMRESARSSPAVAARHRKRGGRRSGCQDQRAVRMTLSFGDDESTVRVDALHSRIHSVDAALGVPLFRMQGDVVGVAPQELLAQRRPCIGNRRVGGEDTHGRLGPVPAEGLRGTYTSRSAADDDDLGPAHLPVIPGTSCAYAVPNICPAYY